ncbi:c-type cytochrome biogenesis protein CcmI [Methylocystis bryophila]|uniref:C-type cytochrome biogenesis protein CcmI n=1 Tax=Methylocystis bryophila TaxID=655015 RepID=A0A1W6MRD4_9HYPH|nr:c-type cytochrome biogenesis protein CcmI [Methylocystis bryophila]ARN80137.1 c-type cytochrome biogenesis protein CcmI [Methylocystis bryophila]BDV40078.1 cytochrome c-type biogenesis protein CycH [Methylocystis bryophila]
MIWVVFAFLAGVACLALLTPLAFESAEPDPGESDRVFYARQIAEIERERAEGRLRADDAEAARLEAARRLLRSDEGSGAPAPGGSKRLRPAAAIGLATLIPLLALALYLKVGAVGLPDAPLEARRELAAAASPDLAKAVARIEAHLAEHPNDGRGFEVVAPYYLRAGRYDEAIHAREEALRLLVETPERHDDLGEALVVAAQGRVTDEAQSHFEAAARIAPGDPMSGYYLGLAAAQQGHADKAREIWERLIASATPDAPYREIISGQLQALSREAPAGAAAEAVAALPDNERMATIRGMVDRLAGRLAQQGDDVEGWLKLLRAYTVLGEHEKATATLADARIALAAKPAEAARVDGLARELGVSEKTAR